MKSKLLKRVGTLALSVLLAMGSFLVTASMQTIPVRAEEKSYDYKDENGVRYTQYSNGDLFVSGYEGTSKHVVIPDSYEGHAIVCIGADAFRKTDIESIVIGDCVQDLIRWTFEECRQLTSVTFGKSVKAIDTQTFYKCEKLATVELPASLESLEYEAFADTAIYDNEDYWVGDGLYIDGWLIDVRKGTSGYFKIAKGTKRVANNLFRMGAGKQITKLGIPASLREEQPLFVGAFSGQLSSITSFVVNKENPYYSYDATDHILYNKDKTKILEVVGKLPKIYKIPAHVTAIRWRAFTEACGAKAIIIPKTVKYIEYGAFDAVVFSTGLLCEAKKQPKGWDDQWAITPGVEEVSSRYAENVHYGYRPTAVSKSKWQGLYGFYVSGEKAYGKTFTLKKRNCYYLEGKLKTGTDSYVRWVSSDSSVLRVNQETVYMSGFYVFTGKPGTVWLTAKNSKGKVIAQYKVHVTAK